MQRNTALITIFAVVGTVLCGPLGRSGPCGGGGSGGRPSPPFLRNVTDEARKGYFGIMHNTNETIAQQKQEIQAWGQKYGVSNQIQEFNVNATKMNAELQQNVTNLINALPTIMQQLLAINNNEDQTRIQQVETLGNLSASNPPLYSVLRFAMDQLSPRHRMGNKGGMMGGHGGCGGPGGQDNSD
ncbi:unnamed protein product [Heligmosomoides polygyrus]|uniref:DUF148 domain-containing protein n=1 Tax=Heligmosomoides polygyrus TaxID=6339 RepID=A0A183FZY7_HELPZ|nr:unnamed protein product [Heligmosomoides polygyrus]